MVDKAKEIEKIETNPQDKAPSKTKTKTSAKKKRKRRRKPIDEVRMHRLLGGRFTAKEYEYVKVMVEELKKVYKSQNKILLEITKEFVNSPINNEIFNRRKKIFLGKWSTIFAGKDIKKVLIAYLQLTRNLFSAPNRIYRRYPPIDFEMVDKDGKRYGVIIKNEGDIIDLDFIDHMRKKIKIYLFTTDEESKEFGEHDVEHIFLKDVFKLMAKYKVLLPVSIVKKIKLIDGIK